MDACVRCHITRPPSDVSASDDTYTDKVRVTWTASSGATSYATYRSTSSSSASASLIGTVASSPYDDTSALAGTTYYYWVKASNSHGDSGFSNSDSGRRAISSKTLSSITVAGASSVTSGNTATYTCTAIYSDSSTATVTPTWSLSSTTYATITSGGLLTAKTVSSSQSVTVQASYTENSVTKTASKAVTINPSAVLLNVDVPAAGGAASSSLLTNNGSVWTFDCTGRPAWIMSAALTYPTGNLFILGSDVDEFSWTGAGTVTVNASANTTGASRSWTLPITISGETSYVITFSQGAATSTLSSISIAGTSSVISGNSATYTCTATYSDGSTATVMPTWSLSSTTYATITAGGTLTAKTVASSQSVSVEASYTEGGVTRTAAKTVTIQPSNLSHDLLFRARPSWPSGFF